MVRIETAGKLNNTEPGEFPDIAAYGEDEQQAADIFTILYNAYQLTPKNPENGAVTNMSESGGWGTTYLVSGLGFKELKEYFAEIHGILLEMEIW